MNAALGTVEEEVFTKTVNDFAQNSVNTSHVMMNMMEQNT